DLVGEASDGAEAVEKAGESLPDVVLMDIRMPKSSGIEACRTMKEVSPSAKIVMLTISDEEGDLFEAIRAGASGYLLKDIPYDEVADVVRAVHGGQSLINPSMAAKLLTEFAALAKRDGEERAQQVPAPKLTDREMEVLRLVAREMNSSLAMSRLFIPLATSLSTSISRSVSLGAGTCCARSSPSRLASAANSVRSLAAMEGLMRDCPPWTARTTSATSS